MAKAYRATSFALIGSFVAALAFPTRPALADADYGAVAQALDDDHDRALEAARALQAGGEPAAEALRDGWDGLSVQAQRRAFDPLSSLAMDEDAAVDCLLAAARNGDSETQEAALLALRRAGPRGQAGIASLLGDPKVGERAATTLARTDPDAAIGPLLGAIESEGGSDDSGLRTALGTAVDRATVDASTSVADWLRGGPSSAAAASAALGLAPVDAQQSSVTALVEYAIPNAQDDFATEWRLARGAAAAGPSETIDRWLINEMNLPNSGCSGALRSKRWRRATDRPTRARASSTRTLACGPKLPGYSRGTRLR